MNRKVSGGSGLTSVELFPAAVLGSLWCVQVSHASWTNDLYTLARHGLFSVCVTLQTHFISTSFQCEPIKILWFLKGNIDCLLCFLFLQNVPTLGVSALNLASLLCDEVSLVGFGYNLSHLGVPLHYYDHLAVSCMEQQKMHNVNRETEFLQRLVRAGTITDLTGGVHCSFCSSWQHLFTCITANEDLKNQTRTAMEEVRDKPDTKRESRYILSEKGFLKSKGCSNRRLFFF